MQNSPRLQQYVRCLAIAAKRVEEKELRREGISMQIGRIKRFSSKSTKGEVFQNALEKLESQVTDLIKKENLVLKTSSRDDMFLKELRENISALQEKIAETTDMLEENEGKMDQLSEAIYRVNQKIVDLKSRPIEKKLEKTLAFDKEEFKKIEKELRFLEERYKELNKTECNKKDLAELKKRIDLNKNKLKKIKT